MEFNRKPIGEMGSRSAIDENCARCDEVNAELAKLEHQVTFYKNWLNMRGSEMSEEDRQFYQDKIWALEAEQIRKLAEMEQLAEEAKVLRKYA